MDTTLLLCGTVVEKVNTFKYLRILINGTLSWSYHIAGICDKARKILGLVYSGGIKAHLPILLGHCVSHLYIHFLSKVQNYGILLYTRYGVNKLEAVQGLVLRIIFHQWNGTYELDLNIVHIQMLQERRLKLKLTQVYKFAHWLFYFSDNVPVLHESHSANLAKRHIKLCPCAHTGYNFHSLVPASERVWNTSCELQACAGCFHWLKK